MDSPMKAGEVGLRLKNISFTSKLPNDLSKEIAQKNEAIASELSYSSRRLWTITKVTPLGDQFREPGGAITQVIPLGDFVFGSPIHDH